MRIFLVVIVFVVSSLSDARAGAMGGLEPYQWKYRIIAHTLHPDDEKNFLAAIAEYADQIEDRDIRFISLNTEKILPTPQSLALEASDRARLRNALQTAANQTELILIGKDGGIKNRIPIVDLSKLFAQVDQMPMRRTEIRDKR